MIANKFIIETLDHSRYDEWNNFVDLSPQGEVFCYSWWLDTITGSNFKIFTVTESGRIVAGFPLAFDYRNKINEPPLTRSLGILYKPQPEMNEHNRSNWQRKCLALLIEALPLSDFVQVCLHHTITDWLPFRWAGLQQTTRYTYLIDYRQKKISEIYSNLDRLRKRMIERAKQANISTELTDDVDLAYEYLSKTYKRQSLKFIFPHDQMKILDSQIVRNGKRIIMKAYDASKVHAVLYAVCTGRSAFCLLSGSDPSLRKKGGHTLVMWETIKYFADKVSYINLGGSDIERIECHLQGFGGVLTPYFHIFNSRLLEERKSLKFHLNELLFHIKAIGSKIVNKL